MNSVMKVEGEIEVVVKQTIARTIFEGCEKTFSDFLALFSTKVLPSKAQSMLQF